MNKQLQKRIVRMQTKNVALVTAGLVYYLLSLAR